MKRAGIVVVIIALGITTGVLITRHHQDPEVHRFALTESVTEAMPPPAIRKKEAPLTTTKSKIAAQRAPSSPSEKTLSNWREWLPAYLESRGFASVEFQNPEVESTERWSRVTLAQSYGGLRILPERAVTLTFDASGRLEEADLNLEKELGNADASKVPTGANSVYIERSEESGIKIHWAKREVSGVEWIAKDISTGEVLWRKINRHY